jgi:hypothetical protein
VPEAGSCLRELPEAGQVRRMEEMETAGAEEMMPKPKSYRNPEYLSFIRSKPCLICGRKAVAAHVRDLAFGGGTNLKPPDYCTVPLCDDPYAVINHHKCLDSGGVYNFEDTFGIYLNIAIIRLMMEYIESKRK